MKAKFGDSLRSRMDTAMVKEVLCKVLCHNVCCLIQSHYELGVEAVFWGQDTTVVEPEPVAVGAPVEAWDWV
jgi:hypothetical protein